MKLKLFCSLLTLSLCVTALCACTQQNKTSQENGKYKLVEATQEDFDNIVPQLEPILAMYRDDYNYEKENMYNNLFHYNVLSLVYPACEEEIEKYIAEPLEKDTNEYGTFRDWYEMIPKEDPLGKFGKIPEGAYDENGVYDEYRAKECITSENYKKDVIGHFKYVGEYIDFLVEGVWNGKVDHKTFFTLENSRCYYHDGFYYTPEWGGDRGGNIVDSFVYLNSITPLENNKYRIEFSRHYDDYFGTTVSCAVAVLGLKETKDGFRFWSIYELEQDE